MIPPCRSLATTSAVALLFVNAVPNHQVLAFSSTSSSYSPISSFHVGSTTTSTKLYDASPSSNKDEVESNIMMLDAYFFSDEAKKEVFNQDVELTQEEKYAEMKIEMLDEDEAEIEAVIAKAARNLRPLAQSEVGDVALEPAMLGLRYSLTRGKKIQAAKAVAEEYKKQKKEEEIPTATTTTFAGKEEFKVHPLWDDSDDDSVEETSKLLGMRYSLAMKNGKQRRDAAPSAPVVKESLEQSAIDDTTTTTTTISPVADDGVVEVPDQQQQQQQQTTATTQQTQSAGIPLRPNVPGKSFGVVGENRRLWN